MGIYRERFDTVIASKKYHWVQVHGDNRAQLHPGPLMECEDPSCKEYDRP